MSIDFSKITGLSDSRGVITQITDASGAVIWAVQSGGKVILQVEKITSDTYAAETTYTGEQFILLDIYPKTNGTVTVTYGGLTKTITDTSGAEEPNAQQVFFGTFNGVSDSVATPASGELTIEGDYAAFGIGKYAESNKGSGATIGCTCVIAIQDFGKTKHIPDSAFNETLRSSDVTARLTGELVIPSTIKSIGKLAFCSCKNITSITIHDGVDSIGSGAFAMNENLETVNMLSTTPPILEPAEDGSYSQFVNLTGDTILVERIVVQKDCGNTYKTTIGWDTYASVIEEAS